MRVLAVFALSSVVFAAVQSAAADPAQSQAQTTQSVTSTTASPSAATGSPTTPSQPVAVQETVKVHPPLETDNLDTIVCKTSPPKTGSRLGGSRECHTEREWKVQQQQSQDMLSRTQSMGMQQPIRQ